MTPSELAKARLTAKAFQEVDTGILSLIAQLPLPRSQKHSAPSLNGPVIVRQGPPDTRIPKRRRRTLSLEEQATRILAADAHQRRHSQRTRNRRKPAP